jgi:hypothetical protein
VTCPLNWGWLCSSISRFTSCGWRATWKREKCGQKRTYQIGSVTINTKGLLRLTLSNGKNAFFSSNRLHHLGSPVSFLNLAALFRKIVGPYVSLTIATNANATPARIITSQLVLKHPSQQNPQHSRRESSQHSPSPTQILKSKPPNDRAHHRAVQGANCPDAKR